MAQKINSREEFDKLIQLKDKTVIIDFYADWCGPCRMISPILEAIEAERGDVLVGKLNVDEHMDIAQEFRVVSIPMVLVYKNGEQTAKIIGYQSREEIEAQL